MSLIVSLEHAYAIGIGKLKTIGRAIENSVLPILQKVHADAATIEAVTAVVSPQLANLERVGDALLGTVIKAIEDAGAAAAAGGLSVSLDAQLVADIKAIIPSVKSAAPPAPTPAAPAPAA